MTLRLLVGEVLYDTGGTTLLGNVWGAGKVVSHNACSNLPNSFYPLDGTCRR